LKKWWVPLGILCAGFLGVAILVVTRPRPEVHAPPAHVPIVTVQKVVQGPVHFVVHAQGSVAPRRQSALVPQVSGEVVWTSPALMPGGFFEAGDVLLRIDRADYAAALESVRAAVARTTSEERRAGKERDRQRRLRSQSAASAARVDDAENGYAVARAALREARARLTTAERDLARTEVRAPYAGRVRSESVGVGEYVNRGSPVGELYAVDWAEVRLPVPDRELRYVNVPLRYRPAAHGPADAEAPEARSARARQEPSDGGPGVAVTLRAEFAGTQHSWSGRIVRTEGEIDPKSRMVTLVARVEDPYGRSHEHSGPPLAVGLFVEAEIQGREVQNAIVLPRMALREGDQVLIVDAQSRLRIRSVEVLRRERDDVVLGAGLAPGERVCTSAIPGALEGMKVRVARQKTRAVVGSRR